MGDFEKAMEDSRKAGDAKIKMECITDCVDYLNKLRTQFTDDFERKRLTIRRIPPDQIS